MVGGATSSRFLRRVGGQRHMPDHFSMAFSAKRTPTRGPAQAEMRWPMPLVLHSAPARPGDSVSSEGVLARRAVMHLAFRRVRRTLFPRPCNASESSKPFD